mmetsp:Transcript_4357/g.7698  ORF Transcript_4357/g.7698 Transcript_4357/m.7698 type:complete len:217 (-) Transcript_4357:75-725(-)
MARWTCARWMCTVAGGWIVWRRIAIGRWWRIAISWRRGITVWAVGRWRRIVAMWWRWIPGVWRWIAVGIWMARWQWAVASIIRCFLAIEIAIRRGWHVGAPPFVTSHNPIFPPSILGVLLLLLLLLCFRGFPLFTVFQLFFVAHVTMRAVFPIAASLRLPEPRAWLALTGSMNGRTLGLTRHRRRPSWLGTICFVFLLISRSLLSHWEADEGAYWS